MKSELDITMLISNTISLRDPHHPPIVYWPLSSIVWVNGRRGRGRGCHRPSSWGIIVIVPPYTLSSFSTCCCCCHLWTIWPAKASLLSSGGGLVGHWLSPASTVIVCRHAWKDVMVLFLGSALFLVTFFHATSPFPGSLSYAYHHYLLILGPLTFTI